MVYETISSLVGQANMRRGWHKSLINRHILILKYLLLVVYQTTDQQNFEAGNGCYQSGNGTPHSLGQTANKNKDGY